MTSDSNTYISFMFQDWCLAHLHLLLSPSFCLCLCSPSPHASPFWEASCWHALRGVLLIFLERHCRERERERKGGMKVTHCSRQQMHYLLVPTTAERHKSLSRDVSLLCLCCTNCTSHALCVFIIRIIMDRQFAIHVFMFTVNPL